MLAGDYADEPRAREALLLEDILGGLQIQGGVFYRIARESSQVTSRNARDMKIASVLLGIPFAALLTQVVPAIDGIWSGSSTAFKTRRIRRVKASPS